MLSEATALLERPASYAHSYLRPMAAVLHGNARDPAVSGEQRMEALRLAEACEARADEGPGPV